MREVSRSVGGSRLICNDVYLVCYAWWIGNQRYCLRMRNSVALTERGQCVLCHLQLVEVGGRRAVQ